MPPPCRVCAGSAVCHVRRVCSNTGVRDALRRGLLQQRRATNYNEEYYERVGKTRPEDDPYVFSQSLQTLEAGKPLEKTIGESLLETAASTDINPDHMLYWFSEPEGGWQLEPKQLLKAETLPFEWATAQHFGEGRTPLQDIKEGEVVNGVINQLHLYHGAFVDIGCEFDGLVPWDTMEEWESIVGELDVEQPVRVRVHKVRNPEIYRWPIQLVLVNPAKVQRKLIHPDQWRCPIDTRGRTVEEIYELTGEDLMRNKAEFLVAEFTQADWVDEEIFEDMYGASRAAVNYDETLEPLSFEDHYGARIAARLLS